VDGYQLSLINKQKEDGKELQEITFFADGSHDIT
jgi:hypothetical protein